MNKKKIMSAIKALAVNAKGNAKLIKENQQAISKLTQRFEVLNEHSDYLDKLTTELSHALPDPEHDARCNEITQAPDADLRPGDVLLCQDPHRFFEEGARYIVADNLRVKDLQGDEWPFLRKNKDLYVFGLDDAITACFVKAEEEVHG